MPEFAYHLLVKKLRFSYLELEPLTADPELKEGRIWFRSDTQELRWTPD